MQSAVSRFRWLVGLAVFFLAQGMAWAQAQQPAMELSLASDGSGELSLPLRILLFLTALVFIPSILISVTAFVRITVVLHFLRQALGTQQAPNNQVVIGLSLFLTFFVMGPVWDQVYETAVVPYQQGEIDEWAALMRAEGPLRGFMLHQVREQDLALFVKAARAPRPATPDDIPFRVLVPAFMISELRTAFNIGFILFLPFLVIDMVISSVLLSMGMLQLPPVMISMPFKILLFILVDGWNLIVGSLLTSFRM